MHSDNPIMKIKSRLRLIVVPVILFVIGGCGIVPFIFVQRFIDDDKFSPGQDSIFWITLLVSLLFVALQFYILYIITTKTLLININEELKTIGFFQPFLFKREIFSFEEIEGFRFTSYQSKSNEYKCIIFKIRNNKTFSITDFETSNFREIENFSIGKFILTKGKDFETLSSEEREAELIKNKNFDIKQAKDYRFSCYLNIVLIVFIYFIDKYISFADRRIGWLGFWVCIIFLYFSIDKIIQANKTIKAYTQY